jgi:IMP cyclohydrolase
MTTFGTQEEKDWLLGLLREQEVEVTFVKKDGTERVMLCTLDENSIPKEKAPKGVERSAPTESMAVFDVEKQEWRSFRFDSIKRVQAVLFGD